MNEFDIWATERYCLFTLRKNMIFQGVARALPLENALGKNKQIRK